MKGPKHYQNLVSSYMIYMAHFWLFGYRSWVLGSAAPEPELGTISPALGLPYEHSKQSLLYI